MEIQELRRGIHRNQYLQASWDKYGEAAFSFIVLCNCLKEEVRLMEQHYISLLNKDLLMNLGKVGDFFETRLETKQKLSNLHKGRKRKPMTKEHRENISKAHKGKKLSEETKKKIGAAFKGRSFSKEHLEKLSKANKGRPPAQATRNAVATANKRRKQLVDKGFLKSFKNYRIVNEPINTEV